MLETETSYTAMLEIVWKPTQEPDPHFKQLCAEAASSERLCVVNAIVSDLDRILILRRTPWKSFLPDCWDLPGGHVAAGESLEAALRREVAEEIGARIGTIDALIAVWDWEHRAGGGKQTRCDSSSSWSRLQHRALFYGLTLTISVTTGGYLKLNCQSCWRTAHRATPRCLRCCAGLSKCGCSKSDRSVVFNY